VPLGLAELCAALAGSRRDAAGLPAQLTLLAPGELPYATLVGALSAAHARGVRRARVVVAM
jgi:hypothetical protein